MSLGPDRRPHQRNRWPAAGCASAIAGATVVGAWYLLTPSVRDPYIRQVSALIVLAAFGILSYFSAFHAWQPGFRVLAVAAPVSVLLSGALVWKADELHWQWSRDAFARVAAGEMVDCPPSQTCRLGWWRIADTTRYDDIVVVWLPTDGCYAGAAYAKPTEHDPGWEVLRSQLVTEVGTEMLAVYPFRDGWYEVCITS